MRGSRNAFLTLDRDKDGKISSGKELFGHYTVQPQSPDQNGFLARAEFDKPENGGNGDGVIDNKDSVFPLLLLWIDENHDGIAQMQKLHTLPSLEVFSLSLKYKASRRTIGSEMSFATELPLTPIRLTAIPEMEDGPLMFSL